MLHSTPYVHLSISWFLEGSIFNSVYLKFYFALRVTGSDIHSELHLFILFLMTTMFPQLDAFKEVMLFFIRWIDLLSSSNPSEFLIQNLSFVFFLCS